MFSVVLWFVAALSAVVTFLPLMKLPHGAIKGIGFVRMQTLVVSMLAAAVAFFVLDGPQCWWVTGTLGLSSIVNAVYIAKFTPV